MMASSKEHGQTWDQGQFLLCGTESGRKGPGLSSGPVPGLSWAREASQPAPKPTGAHPWMAEHSGKELLREIRAIGNAENCLPDSSPDEPGRPTVTVSSISCSPGTGSCELRPTTGLHNQGRVNGQEEGQEAEIKNQECIHTWTEGETLRQVSTEKSKERIGARAWSQRRWPGCLII